MTKRELTLVRILLLVARIVAPTWAVDIKQLANHIAHGGVEVASVEPAGDKE